MLCIYQRHTFNQNHRAYNIKNRTRTNFFCFEPFHSKKYIFLRLYRKILKQGSHRGRTDIHTLSKLCPNSPLSTQSVDQSQISHLDYYQSNQSCSKILSIDSLKTDPAILLCYRHKIIIFKNYAIFKTNNGM